MHKKVLITLLILVTPIAFIEQHKNSQALQIDSAKFNTLNLIDTNNHPLTNLLGELIITDIFHANEKNSIEIKYCWKEGDLASQKRHCSSTENLLHKFNK